MWFVVLGVIFIGMKLRGHRVRRAVGVVVGAVAVRACGGLVGLG